MLFTTLNDMIFTLTYTSITFRIHLSILIIHTTCNTISEYMRRRCKRDTDYIIAVITGMQ